ncbi:ATP-binding cassette domain-containing protein [Marivita sp.]|uniref:amino acid ABC transporter ATP-binding/permease protein n=1 Tax=Marivita sp. TaxID=2003365 RepID=UPI002634AFB5|nr:ATP-binding cassette domain-containing protein [Marivita sp.]
MRSLFQIIRLLLAGERRAFVQGMALSVTVLVMGVALLALSGWFITAAAAAGMIGLGTLFNVFAPSAMVRFLALGRTAARYGERLTTHDATLRALSNLRVRLLRGVLMSPYRQIERLRASVFLNRVTSDIDALDGLALRLVLPGLAGLLVIAVTALAVALLVHPTIAVVILLGYAIGPTLVFLWGKARADKPSRKAQAGMQALRSRVIDLIAMREELIVFGQVRAAQSSVERAADFQSESQSDVERIERETGLWLDITGWAVVASALGIGASLAQAGEITAARAAIGIFAALALSEAVAPVRRALSEIGRMRAAAKRIVPMINKSRATQRLDVNAKATTLVAEAFAAANHTNAPLFDPVSFSVAPGETVALTGRSGCGKSTVLLQAAGHGTPSRGTLKLGGLDVDQIDTELRTRLIAMVPQMHALVAGTIAENLRLAAPAATDAELWAMLEAVQLAETVAQKGGLDAQLGFRGAGLSGGEARRMALARALLRKPKLLLLDEPTEGLDAPLASRVLAGIRATLPDAAILMAAHRPEEVDFADRVVELSPIARIT